MNFIELEHKTVKVMLQLYCIEKHHCNDELCDSCNSLLLYCRKKIDKCPFGVQKGTCKNCQIHCYQADKRAIIQNVMKTAGPKMVFKYPFLTIRHIILSYKKFPSLRKIKNRLEAQALTI